MMKKKKLLKSLSPRNRLIIVIIAAVLALCSICSICTICIFLTPTTDKSISSDENKTEEIAGVSTRSTDLEIPTTDNISTTDDSAFIEGTVDETTAKVLINDTEVGLESKDGKKYFAHWMPLEIGENKFLVKSFNEHGKEDKNYTLIITRNEIPTYKVTSITDGDTIRVMYNGKEEKVRLIGIDTPETDECFNQEATKKMSSLVESKNIRIEFDNSQSERDKYGRLLLYIWQGDVFINDVMIREGYAHEYTYNLPYKYQAQFKKAEQEARENKKGLWGNVCTCQEGEEIDRKCISCNKAELTRTHWDCSTYKIEINDNSCTSGCYSPPPQPTTPIYICDCKKTCSQMSSCEEAYYQLNTCKCSKRDGDNDGVPCETICPGG